MSSSGRNREIVRFSFGPHANAATAHLVHLEGLAATHDDDDGGVGGGGNASSTSAICDPWATHRSVPSADRRARVWTPRCVFVDEGFGRTTTTTTTTELEREEVVSWDGAVERMGDGEEGANVVDENDPLTAFRDATRVLAASSGRYDCPVVEPPSSASANRHVNWDDDDDDDEYEDEDEQREQERKRARLSREEELRRRALRERASAALVDLVSSTPRLNWYDWLSPPLPPARPSLVASPSIGGVRRNDDEDDDGGWSYHAASPARVRATAEAASESLRTLLEESDRGVGGARCVVDERPLWSDTAAEVLTELRDECRSVARFAVVASYEGASASTAEGVDAARRRLHRALRWRDLAEHADATLPLSHDRAAALFDDDPGGGPPSLFRGSAGAAAALECAELPARLSSSSSGDDARRRHPPVAVTGATVDADPYATADSVTPREFLWSLRPSPRHVLLELDAVAAPTTKLSRRISEGTSPADERTSERRDWPGRWTVDGTLKRLSSEEENDDDDRRRRQRQHDVFACAVSYRSSSSSSSSAAAVHTRPLLDGLVHRGRPPREVRSIPDRLSTCAVDRSFSDLARGTHWEHLSRSSSSENNGDDDDVALLTVLTNSTRSRATAARRAADLSRALGADRRRRGRARGASTWRALLAREIAAERAPEEDDCAETAEWWEATAEVYAPRYEDEDDGDDEAYFDEEESG